MGVIDWIKSCTPLEIIKYCAFLVVLFLIMHIDLKNGTIIGCVVLKNGNDFLLGGSWGQSLADRPLSSLCDLMVPMEYGSSPLAVNIIFPLSSIKPCSLMIAEIGKHFHKSIAPSSGYNILDVGMNVEIYHVVFSTIVFGIIPYSKVASSSKFIEVIPSTSLPFCSILKTTSCSLPIGPPLASAHDTLKPVYGFLSSMTVFF